VSASVKSALVYWAIRGQHAAGVDGREIAVQQIRLGDRVSALDRRSPRLSAAFGATDRGGGHQALDMAASGFSLLNRRARRARIVA
jgi:hypothetical protein